jgi:hypothetical protein
MVGVNVEIDVKRKKKTTFLLDRSRKVFGKSGTIRIECRNLEKKKKTNERFHITFSEKRPGFGFTNIEGWFEVELSSKDAKFVLNSALCALAYMK